MAHPAQVRLVEQQREYAAFLMIAKQNREFASFLQQYGHQFNVLDQGSASVAQVVEHWQTVFRITHLALASLVEKQVPTSAEDDTPIVPPGSMPDRLVRIPAAAANRDDGDA
ncbi:hypothetical protein RQP46_000823 [Phenoliferia psychrophenolica]